MHLKHKDQRTMQSSPFFLPAEWAKQCAVQLTWPHADTDWRDILDETTRCYIRMAKAITGREKLIIVTPHSDEVQHLLGKELIAEQMKRTQIIELPTDDTWARDHAFITLLNKEGEARFLDYRFNGWGQKFAASQDNQICRRMSSLADSIGLHGEYVNHLDFVLEGGSIESDGEGTILTTSECLLAPNRNEPLTRQQIEARLMRDFGAKRILWLDHGYLAGDDTDSHIDTLARFCPNNTIAYVQCTDPNDEHYRELHLMEQQLASFRTLSGKPYRLVPLPMAHPEFDAEGSRLPATYANFLIINGAVLMPTYGHPELDSLAAHQLKTAFPEHEIMPLDCRILIEQHGSLHCCTMQFPEIRD